MDKNKLQQLINKHIDSYSPDVSEGDHLYNQGKAEGIEIGFDAALAELSKSGEFREFKVFSHNEPHRGYLTVEPLFKLNIPFKNEMLAHAIEITALQAANAKIIELEEFKSDQQLRVGAAVDKANNLVLENVKLLDKITELEKYGKLHMENAEKWHKRFLELEQQLKKVDELLISMHIDTMAWNIQHTEPEILAGWHESNNEKIEQYLKSRGE